jgi:hypothetical protein
MRTRFDDATPRARRFFRAVFLVAALYDGALGALFFLFHPAIYGALGIPSPGNASYIHLTAGFVFVQGVGYWFVWRDMLRNVDIVKMGVVYKALYVAVAGYYLAVGDLPGAVFAWFAVADLVFLALFIAFLRLVRPSEAATVRVHQALHIRVQG